MARWLHIFSWLFFCDTVMLHGQSCPSQQLMDIGLSALGATYVNNALDLHEEECLVYSEAAFDCVTFVEWTIAKYLTSRSGVSNTGDIESVLRGIRYRNGCIDGYLSRLHYFSEWIAQNVLINGLNEITGGLDGAVVQKKSLAYISRNKHLYPRLKNEQDLMRLRAIEKHLSSFEFSMVPKNQVGKVLRHIHHGDLIVFVSALSDLDIAHVGFAHEQGGKVYLLHASEQNKRVEISNEPLDIYLKKRKKIAGIRVLRIES